MEKYIMALDQGTTSSRCMIFNKKSDICGSSQKEFNQIYPEPGWVEQDPMEIWTSQYSVIIEALTNSNISLEQIVALGITNQRETTIVWNKHTGEPIYNAIVWQCRRTASMIDELKKKNIDKIILEKTGLIADAYFSASKVSWILEHVMGARMAAEAGDLLFGTVDSWLIWKLTGGKVHITDYSNASRTMLYDIHELKWSDELLDIFQIPKSMLPEVKPSSCIYGYTDENLFNVKIPIASAAGDQQAALFGHCGFETGDIKNTYGTGCFLLMNTGKKPVLSKHGLLTTIAASLGEEVEYALEGSVFVGGAVVQWLKDGLNILDKVEHSEYFATEVYSNNDMYIVPAFVGMSTPDWNQYARGTIVGLTRGCEKEHFIRAALESIAYQSNDVIRAMEEDLGKTISELRVDGGASTNNFLLKFQADISNVDVIRPKCTETTALGAAYLAGLAVGYWYGKNEIIKCLDMGQTFSTDMSDDYREYLLKGWKRALDTALYWANIKD